MYAGYRRWERMKSDERLMVELFWENSFCFFYGISFGQSPRLDAPAWWWGCWLRCGCCCCWWWWCGCWWWGWWCDDVWCWAWAPPRPANPPANPPEGPGAAENAPDPPPLPTGPIGAREPEDGEIASVSSDGSDGGGGGCCGCWDGSRDPAEGVPGSCRTSSMYSLMMSRILPHERSGMVMELRKFGFTWYRMGAFIKI